MGALFIFILISVLVISALLFLNKGEKAQEIKSILKEIFENFKELFSNFKKLFLIVKELIQEKLDQEPTQVKDESTESKSEVTPFPYSFLPLLPLLLPSSPSPLSHHPPRPAPALDEKRKSSITRTAAPRILSHALVAVAAVALYSVITRRK